MARAQWGGGGDYSGVFSGMANQEQNMLENAAQSGVARAKADSEAKAAEVYNQWKNGQISDDEWLAFLRQKVADSTGDPEEHQRWSDALRDHEGAILDSQMEANYSLGKLSLAGLMAHYSKQMQGVETNSPKWRDYAARYAQIQDAIRGGSGGSGGGGGSSSGSARGVKAGQAVLGRHPDGFAYDVNGEDIIRPANSFVGYSDGGDYINNLFSDVRRIDILMDQLKADPSLTTLHDPYTSWDIPVTPDMLSELDRQYLRTEDQMVAYNEALGTTDGFEAAQKARAAKQTYINGPMMQHNTDRVQPVYDALVQSTAESVAAIGDIPDPVARMNAYKDIAKQWASFEDGTLQGMGGRGIQRAYMGTVNVKGNLESSDTQPQGQRLIHWTEQLPDEMKASGEMFKQAEAWKNFMTSASDPTMDPAQRNLQIQDFLDTVTGGEGMPAKADMLKMIEGDDGSSTGRPITGIIETHDQYNGVVYGADPKYAGPHYVYVNDANGVHLTQAEVREIPHDGGNITAQLVPAGVETSGLVQTITRVGGRTAVVWAEPAPVNDPRFIAYKITNAAQFGGVLKKGDYLPSDWIAKNGGLRKVNQLVAAGALDRESQMQAVDLPDGSRWYIDPQTRLASMQPPALAQQDATTGGILVGSDGKIDLHYGTSAGSVFMPYYGMDRKDAQAYVSKSVREGSIVPTDYGYRNQAGEVSNGPMDGEWDDAHFDNMYWSKQDALNANPKRRAQLGGAHAGDGESLRRSQANDEFVRGNVIERTSGPTFGDILRDPMGSLKRFGEQMGIQMEDPFQKQAEQAPKQPPMHFLPADDAVFGVRQAQAEMARKKTSMLTPAPALAALDAPSAPQANLPVPAAPTVAPIATGRTYTALREQDRAPVPVPSRVAIKPKAPAKVGGFKESL